MKDSRTVIGKCLVFSSLLLIATLDFGFTGKAPAPAPTAGSGLFALYDELQLGALDLSRDAFHRAVEVFSSCSPRDGSAIRMSYPSSIFRSHRRKDACS